MEKSKGKIHIYKQDITYRVHDINKIKLLLNNVVLKEKKNLKEINIILTSDETLYEMNKKYLNHETYTDTITFPYNESKRDVYGDIYISLDRVRDNANTYKCHVKEELVRIMIHGTLHLCGYEDKKDEKGRGKMIEKQESYLKSFI